MDGVQMAANAKLFKKLINVLGAVSAVKKTGRNTHQGYQYATEADILEAVREHLIKEQVFIFTSVEGVERVDNITTVKMLHTFVDGETGGHFVVSSFGQGKDSQDKGVYKAITGAMKYFLAKNFLTPTQDDPESDGANKSYVRKLADSAPQAPKTFGSAPTSLLPPVSLTEDNITKTNTPSKPSFSTMKSEDIPY